MKNLFKTSILGKVEQSRAETTLINPTPIFFDVIILLYCKAAKRRARLAESKNENTKTSEKAQYIEGKRKYRNKNYMMSL